MNTRMVVTSETEPAEQDKQRQSFGSLSYSELLADRNLHKIIDVLLSDQVSLESITTDLLQVARELTGSAQGLVGLVDPTYRSLDCHTTWGAVPGSSSKTGRRVKFFRSPNGQFVSRRGYHLNTENSFYNNEPVNDENIIQVPGQVGRIENYLSAPAIVGNHSFGLITVANKEDGYTDDDLMVMNRLSGLFALFVMRKRMEERLQSSEERYRDMLNDAIDMIHILDPEGRIVDTNPMELSVMGYSKEAYLGTPLLELIHPDFLEKTEKALKRVFDGEKVKGLQTAVITSRGNTLKLEVNMVPQFESGVMVAAMVFSRDITRRIEEENQLRHAQENLEKTVEARTRELQNLVREERETKNAMLNMLEDLELSKNEAMAATRAKSLFLANMSHEIRTPVNAVLGMLHLAQDMDLNEEQQQYLQKSQQAAIALRGIIDDILDFSKIEAGKLELDHSDFFVESMIRQVSEMVGYRAAQKGLELLVYVDSGVPGSVCGDSARLGQILTNLCTNAIKFTEQGEIEVRVGVEEMTGQSIRLEFRITDTGIGISEEEHGDLFNEFNQVDATYTRKYGGTGLGLSISARLAQMMGGRCWLERSEPGLGSTFCFTVSLDRSNLTDTQQVAVQEQLKPLLENKHFLVVDDSEHARDHLGELLRRQGISFDAVSSGKQALKFLEASGVSVDVVLVNQDMAGMDGSRTMQVIRESRYLSSVPRCILISGVGSPGYVPEKGPRLPDALLLKPVLSSKLLEVILSVLGDPASLRTIKADAHKMALPDMGNASLLLVEDNLINREVARQLLERTGALVTEAVNGEEAVEQVRKSHFDGVLMDIQMPRVDGIQATRQIRAMSASPGDRFDKLPIIAMTAQATAGDKAASLEAGMNDFITKPVNLDRLASVLRHWVMDSEGSNVATVIKDSKVTQPPKDLAAAKAINFEEGLARLGGNETLFFRLLAQFADEYENSVQEIRNLIGQGNLTEAETQCHGLKGVAGNLSINLLFALARSVDDQLKQEITPTDAELEQFETSLQDAISEIKTIAR
ncbi:MAG: response regulator [Xanthomonadales bacterium]|nr:response regulator [Xanthomonadales bacterium]